MEKTIKNGNLSEVTHFIRSLSKENLKKKNVLINQKNASEGNTLRGQERHSHTEVEASLLLK